MGSLHEWTRVAFLGGGWALVMHLSDAPSWRFPVRGSLFRDWFWYCLSVIFTGAFLGMCLTFAERLFHGGLGVIFSTVVVVGLFARHVLNRRAKKSHNTSPLALGAS